MADIQDAVDTSGMSEKAWWASQTQKGAKLSKEESTLSSQEQAALASKKANTDEAVKQATAKAEEMKPAREAIIKGNKEPFPEAHYTEAKPFEPPKIDPKEANEAFGMLMVVSMLVGLSSRGPYNNMMTAMTGALTGLAKGDQESFNRAKSIYDENLAVIKNNNDIETKNVELAIKKHGNNLQALRDDLQMIAGEHDDQLAITSLKDKSISDSVNLIESKLKQKQTAIDKLDALQEKFQERKMYEKSRAQAHADALRAKTPTPIAANDASGQMALDIQAWDWLTTQKLPYRKGTGGGADRNDAVQRRGAEIAISLGKTPQGIATMPAEWKANAGSMLIQQKKADAIDAQLSSFHNNLDTWNSIASGVAPKLGGDRVKEFTKEMKKVDFIGIRTLDDMKLRVEQEFNDPTVSALMIAAMAAAMDYARIMQGPQSIASLTEGARKDAERLVSVSADERGRRGIMAALESDTAGQVKGLKDQLQVIKDRMAGKKETRRSTDKITPEDQSLIEKYLTK